MGKEARPYDLLLIFCVVALLVLSGFALHLYYVEEPLDRVPGRGWYKLDDMNLAIGSPYLEAAVMGGLYLVNCQRSDGSFNYYYYPGKDEYSTSDNMLRQLGTTYSILLLYKHYPEHIFLETGELAMKYVEKHVDHIDSETAHILHDGDSKLGGTALAILCYVMFEKVADLRYRDTLDALGNFIISSQMGSGEFDNYYMMDGKIPAEGDEYYHKHTDYYPGEAFLALSFLYEHTREEKYKECWDRAFDHYYDYYGGSYGRYTPFSPWAVGAALIMYEFDYDERYVNMSESMAGSVLTGQDQYPADFEIPEYVGGFYYSRYKRYVNDPVNCSESDREYQPRANTASKIEPPMDHYWMMERYGLPGNREVYRERMELACRFLGNLQYNGTDAKEFPSSKKAYGGVPGGVSDPNIRIDFNQHAMVAWIKAYAYLELKEGILFSCDNEERVLAREWHTLDDMDNSTDSEYLEASVMGGLYLVNCQRPDGSFNYQYDPLEVTYSGNDNMLRQLGTTYSVLLLYKNYPHELFLEAGELAMGYAERHVAYIDEDTAHVVHDGDSKLGGTALAILCYVMFEKVADERYGDTLDALGNFIIFSQMESGEFDNYYMMDGKIPVEGDKYYHKHTDYYPGEAFLALSFLYQHTREEKYKDCWDRAYDHYYEYYGKERAYYTPFSPWATGAMLTMYEFDNDERYVLMSRSMSDSVLSDQDQFPEDFEIEEYRGGFYYGRYLRYQADPDGEPDYYPRANTASKIEGTMDFHRMIEEYDLPDNESFTGSRMLLASDFLVRLQYNGTDVEEFASPRRAYGGVPGGTNDPEVRIDYVQHAIVAWIKTYNYLLLEKGILD